MVGLYRQFKLIKNRSQLTEFNIQLKQITDFLKENQQKVILGDFNLDFYKRDQNNYAQRRLYDELIEVAFAFDLVQLIREITWT